MKMRDLTDLKFGRLTVLYRSYRGSQPHRRVYWECRCECGEHVVVVADTLTNGRTSSCGCLRTEMIVARSLTHGHTRGSKQASYRCSPEYRAWCHAKARCNNPHDAKFSQYGARGIKMCSEWANKFQAFFDYMGPRPQGTTLDRINNDGNYEPGNCRWANGREQRRNKQQSVYVTWNGEKLILKELAQLLGLKYKYLHRLYRHDGVPLDQAVQKCPLA